MNNTYIIRATATFLGLAASYILFMQIDGLLSTWKYFQEHEYPRSFLRLQIYCIVVSFTLSLLMFAASYQLFRLRRLGRYLANLALIMHVIILAVLVLVFYFAPIFSGDTLEGEKYLTYWYYSPTWETIVYPILYVAAFVVINLKGVRKELIAQDGNRGND